MKSEMVKKLMELKGGKKPMSDIEKDAKLSVLKGLRSEAMGSMKDPLAKLKKVSVASDSAEGLKEGLEVAEEAIEGEEEGGIEALSAEGMEDEEYADCSAEELEQKIQKLQELKSKKLSEQV